MSSHGSHGASVTSRRHQPPGSAGAAPATLPTVTTPGGTTLGGAALTSPALTRASRLPAEMAAVNGSDRMRRAPGRVARRSGAEVSTGGTRLARRCAAIVVGLPRIRRVYRRGEGERPLRAARLPAAVPGR